jgi:hypothetical protein
MKIRYPHILRVLVALWAMMVPLVSFSTTGAANFHAPKRQADLPQFLQAIEQENQHSNYVQPKKMKIRPTQQPSAPRSSSLVAPTITVQNSLLNRQISTNIQSGNNQSFAQQTPMYSVAARLRETHRNNSSTSVQGPAFAVNDCMQTTTYSGAAITAVGATEAAAMYGTVTPPTIRRGPPGTGGGDPVNPDIPVPVGSGVWILLMAGAAYAGYKKRQSTHI